MCPERPHPGSCASAGRVPSKVSASPLSRSELVDFVSASRYAWRTSCHDQLGADWARILRPQDGGLAHRAAKARLGPVRCERIVEVVQEAGKLSSIRSASESQSSRTCLEHLFSNPSAWIRDPPSELGHATDFRGGRDSSPCAYLPHSLQLELHTNRSTASQRCVASLLPPEICGSRPSAIRSSFIASSSRGSLCSGYSRTCAGPAPLRLFSRSSRLV